MPCDTRLKPRQTLQDRAKEVRETLKKVEKGLALGSIKPVIGPQGAVTFLGLTEADRDGVTDACIYRRILATGSVLAKNTIARAEQLSGRTVNKLAIAQGWHSHDGGKTWGRH